MILPQARFDKISTPEIRNYMALSEREDGFGVVLSVSKNGDINLTKFPESAWHPDFKSFSSFDNVSGVITTRATVPIQNMPKSFFAANAALSVPPRLPTVSPAAVLLSVNSAPQRLTPASGRRGAIKNTGRSADMLATFAAGAVADEQRNHANEAAQNLPSTPPALNMAQEEKKLSPPVSLCLLLSRWYDSSLCELLMLCRLFNHFWRSPMRRGWSEKRRKNGWKSDCMASTTGELHLE